MTPSLQVRFAPALWFSNRVTLGADLTQGRGFQLFPKNDFGWYPDRLPAGNGDVSTSQEDDRSYTVEYMGNISTSFGGEGQFSSNLSVGSQYIHRITHRLSGAGAGLATNSAYLVTNAATSTVGQGFGESRSLGFLAQEQIGYRDRVFVQVGLRADRNSAFGDEVGTFFLPKLGASYVVSEESFWKGFSAAIPTMRLRAAYGTTGRSPAAGSSLQTYSTAKFVTDAGLLELGIVPGNPGNPNLKPERGKELELGFDAGFFDDRIGAEITYFNKKSTDLLVSIPVAPSAGFGSTLGNIGEVVNRGIEFLLRATPINSPNLRWDLGISGSTLHNEILSLGSAGTFINNFRAFVEGRSIAAWWVYRIRSVDEATGRVIVSDTAEYSGDQLPKFQANLSTSLTLFGTLRLDALIERKSGYDVLNLNQEFRDRSSRSSASVNLPAEEGGYSPTERLRRLGPYFRETSGTQVGAAECQGSVSPARRPRAVARTDRDVFDPASPRAHCGRIGCIHHCRRTQPGLVVLRLRRARPGRPGHRTGELRTQSAVQLGCIHDASIPPVVCPAQPPILRSHACARSYHRQVALPWLRPPRLHLEPVTSK